MHVPFSKRIVKHKTDSNTHFILLMVIYDLSKNWIVFQWRAMRTKVVIEYIYFTEYYYPLLLC